MNVLETTDENDDVSSRLVVSRSGDWVGLGLSGIGPFAALIHQDQDEQYFWVTTPDQGPTPLAKTVAGLVEEAGFLLLTRGHRDEDGQDESLGRLDRSNALPGPVHRHPPDPVALGRGMDQVRLR